MKPKRVVRNVLFVDPGLDGTGVAYWQMLRQKNPTIPHDADSFRFGRGSLFLRAQRYAQEISCFTAYRTDLMVVEFPVVWSRSEKSFASATRGDLLKLAYSIGAMVTALDEVCPRLKVEFVTPSEWKGQMSKRAVDKRIERALKAKYPPHVSDAVGMGLAYVGAL